MKITLTLSTADHGLIGKSILAANSTHICMFDFRALTGNNEKLSCFVDGLKQAEHLAVDTEDHLIFYSEQTTNTINTYDTITRTNTSLYLVDKVSGKITDNYRGKLNKIFRARVHLDPK